MSAKAPFRQADVERACKGVTAAGLRVARVVVEQGRIEVIVDEEAAANRRNPLDKLYAA